jgi:hypothetical protein
MNLMTPILVMLALGFAPDDTKKPTETVIYKGAIIHTANAMPIINGYLVVKMARSLLWAVQKICPQFKEK